MARFVRDAHAVLLPVTGELRMAPWLRDLLRRGTLSVLAGETRAEYVAREMSVDRRAHETAADFAAFAAQVQHLVAGPTLIAVDQEPWGIARLHDLVPSFPGKESLPGLRDEEIRASAAGVAEAARGMGVNVFLAPVVDVLAGANPWLAGRTLAGDYQDVGRIAAAYVQGVQASGVVAVAKHFPGHPRLDRDPALHRTELDAVASTQDDLVPFAKVIAAGVHGVMTGPVVVRSMDADQPSSTSAKTVGLLREQGFQGLVVSDDLDAPSTTCGRSLVDTMIASLEAGVDLLLVPGGPSLSTVAEEVGVRAERDVDLGIRLASAADRVRKTARLVSGEVSHV